MNFSIIPQGCYLCDTQPFRNHLPIVLLVDVAVCMEDAVSLNAGLGIQNQSRATRSETVWLVEEDVAGEVCYPRRCRCCLQMRQPDELLFWADYFL